MTAHVAPNGDASGVAARHSSASVEHYTPATIVEAARATMGAIDLDPASCALANETVKAARYFDVAANGFMRFWSAGKDGPGSTRWASSLFLNPPGGWCDSMGRRVIKATRTSLPCTESGACGLAPWHEHLDCDSAAKAWWWRLQRELERGTVAQAVYVGFSVEILQSTQVDVPFGLKPCLAYPLCFPSRRVAYLVEHQGKLKVGGSPPHSTVIVYVGPRVAAFREAFAPLGAVVNLGAAS